MDTHLIIQDITNIFTTVSVVIGIVIALRNLSGMSKDKTKEKEMSQGLYLLEFDKMIDRYDDINIKLRPNGEWTKKNSFEGFEWAQIERYMGLFERIKLLIDDGFIDIDVFDRLYGYRIKNITVQPLIKEVKLENNASGWKDFIELARKIKAF